VHAVNGVDLKLERGETPAIVGESGFGRSATLRALIFLNPEHVTSVKGSDHWHFCIRSV